MKRILRIIVGSIFSLLGIGLVALSIYYLARSLSLWSVVPIFIAGIVVLLAGIRVIAGDKLADIFGDFLMSS